MMKVPMNRKIRLLSELFVEAPNPWQVTGITLEALKVFKNYGFKKETGMKINRSHIVDRNTTYSHMLIEKFQNIDEWWDFFLKNDKTILTTASENLTKKFSEIIEIKDETLFAFRGFSWRHTKHEKAFLEKLYNSKFKIG